MKGAALGGSLLNENEEIDGKRGLDWAQGVIAELASLAECDAACRAPPFSAGMTAMFSARSSG